MANKKVMDYLYTTIIAGGVVGGMVLGGMTLGAMDNLATQNANYDNISSKIMNSDSRLQLVMEQEKAILDAYKNGIINAEEFTRQMAEIHSQNYAYDNRYKITDNATAEKWEKADAAKWDAIGNLVNVSVGAGVALAASGLACIGKASQDGILNTPTTPTSPNRKEEPIEEDENYMGA